MKNFKKKGKVIHSLACSANDNQFKGEKQLNDLSEVVNFVSQKFDELETDILEKGKFITDIKSKVSSLKEKLKIW